jgi:minor extracellular serine protease Vpr
MNRPVLCVLMLVALGLPPATAATKPFYRQRHAPPGGSALTDTVVLNAASFEPGICPGGLATIFGPDLTSVSSVVIAPRLPLPTVLANVSVVVNGVPAPIYSIAFADRQDQISFQVPYATATGPGAVEIEVFDGDIQTADIFTDSFVQDPGIFVYNNHALAVHPSDGALVTPDDPAFPGEVLILYATGLGPLSIPLADGYPAPSSPLAYTIEPFQVIVEGESSEVLFSGLAPGFDGVYQINFRVPRDAPSGALDIFIQSPYATSRTVALPVD